MKRLLSAIVLCAMGAICATGADFTGKWIGTITGDDSGVAMLLQLRQDGNALIGVGIFKGGGPMEFTGTAHENHARFELKVDYNRPPAVFELTLDGDRISCAISEGAERSNTATFERLDSPAKPTGVAGMWVGTVTEGSKPGVPGGVFLRPNGAAVVGFWEIDDTEQAVTGTIRNDQVTLSVDNQVANLTWKNGKLSGTFGTEGEPDKYKFDFSRPADRHPGPGLSGNWAGVFLLEDDTTPFVLHLTQSGQEISGEFNGKLGRTRMEAVKFNGKKISFEATMEGHKVHIDAELTHDYRLEGQAVESRDGEAREPAKVSAMKLLDW